MLRYCADCPYNITITPPEVCQAFTTVTCSAESYPPPTYVWWDLLTNTLVAYGPTYTIPVGFFHLMCIASNNVTCFQDYPICKDAGSLYDQKNRSGEADNFPFYLFNQTTSLSYGSSEYWEANATIKGYAIRE